MHSSGNSKEKFPSEHSMKHTLRYSHKKRKDSLEGCLDRVLLAAELEFPKILTPRLPQRTSDINIQCVGKLEWSKQLYSLHVSSFLERRYILILLLWFYYSLTDDAWRKLCNIWLLLCENNSRSITILELNTWIKYCYSYYSRQGNRWQFEKTN